MISKLFHRWFLYCMVAVWFVMWRWFVGAYHDMPFQCFVLIGAFVEGLKPEPVLTVTEWSEKHRRLSSKGAYEHGPYKVSRTPYLRKIMDAMSARSLVRKIILMKASQLGATEAGFNIVAYYIDCVPCPIMYIMPTVDVMERRVKQTVDPMIEECPRLLQKVGKKRSRDGGNTLAQKDYPGGTLFLSGANSAASLASVPVRVAIPDEADRYPDDVDNEGSVLSLIDRRMMTFGSSKKLFMPSTPTIEGQSRIETEFLLTDQQYYYVPCPHCVKLQKLEFEQMKWVKGKYGHDEVHYECIHCKEKIYNRHKTWMLAEKCEARPDGAEWIAEHPELASPYTMGFHLNGLYSPDGWMSWEEIAEEWDKAENDEPKKKAFINTILGKTYRIKGEAPPWQQLFERSGNAGLQRNVVWSDVAFLTAGVDVQGDRLEVEIVGWMKGRCSQQIDYRVLDGDPRGEEVWDKLGELLNESWSCLTPDPSPKKERGGSARQLQIRIMAIDTQYNAPKVHDFCRKWGVKRVVPIQGRDSLDMPFAAPKVVGRTKLGKGTGKVKVWGVGVSYLKTQLYGWLRLTIPTEGDMAGVVPAGYCHFLPLEGHYFRGLTAEELVPVRSKKTNAITYSWVKRYARNEPLDCRVYATAAAYITGFERWDDKRWEKECGNAGNVKNAAKSVEELSEEAKRREDINKQDEPDGPKGAKKKRRSKGGFWS